MRESSFIKISSKYVFVALSLFSLVIVGAFTLYRAEESIEEKETNLLRAVVSLEKLRAGILQYRLAVTQYTLSLKEDEMTDWERRIEKSLQRVVKNPGIGEATISSQQERDLYQKLVQDGESYLRESRKVVSSSRENQAITNLGEQSEALFGRLTKRIDELVELNVKAIDSSPSLWKALRDESGLAAYILSIIVTTVILIYVFNLFDRVTRIAILRKK